VRHTGGADGAPLTTVRPPLAAPSESTAIVGRRVDLEGRGRGWVREAAGPPGAPTLVLLHGLGATAALNWGGTIPALAERYRVLAPDHRGHGRGIRCGGRFSLEDCAEDVAQLIRQECDGPVLVAGYSMGGPIAQLLARDHPDLVAGLVLCATSRDFNGTPVERARFLALAPLAVASRLVPQLPPLVPDVLRHHRLLGELVAEMGGHERRALVVAAASLGGFTSRTWVCDLTTPAAVVVTLQDTVVPVRRQRKLATCLDAPVVELDAGHFVPHSDPVALATAVLGACAHLPGAARPAGVAGPGPVGAGQAA
jgi:pimeloyl-ACP methyl ester carboxylesterase